VAHQWRSYRKRKNSWRIGGGNIGGEKSWRQSKCLKKIQQKSSKNRRSGGGSISGRKHQKEGAWRRRKTAK